jgi:hypothetical protein
LVLTHISRCLQRTEIQDDPKNGNFRKIQTCKIFLWRQHAVDRSTDSWLPNGEVVCNSRFLFRSAANCTLLPLRISKVPIFWVTLYNQVQSKQNKCRELEYHDGSLHVDSNWLS